MNREEWASARRRASLRAQQQSGIPAGQYRHILVFQVMTATQDASGAHVETWATDFQVYGAFEAVNSREFPAFEKRNEETTARFRIHYREDIDPATHRILYAGRTWNITRPIDVNGRKVELQIEASETN